jgi:hypothetical protein
MAWWPNTRTGRRSRPWNDRFIGDVLQGATDAGTPLSIWKPDDGVTYWCHGFTFGGSTARGGPYSLWGSDVPTVLRDDGWKPQPSCLAQAGDILVFWQNGDVTHSGRITAVSAPGAHVDENASMLASKPGQGTFGTLSASYGSYRCFSKTPSAGPCNGNGDHEL